MMWYEYDDELRKQEWISKKTDEVSNFLKAEELYNMGKYQESAKLYRLSALPSSSETIVEWTYILRKGIDGIKYIDKTIELLKQAAENNYVIAMTLLAIIYEEDFDKPDYERVFYYANMSAEHGDGAGQYILGTLYYYGRYVKRDMVEARSCFEKVQDSTYKDRDLIKRSHYILGMMNYLGEGCDISYQRARYYFEAYINEFVQYKKYELDVDVYKYLGMIYLKGLDVEKDLKKAHDYFMLSEKIEENNEIEFWIGILIAGGFIDDYVRNEKYWLKKSYEKGNENARKCLEDSCAIDEYIGQLIQLD